MTRRFERKKNYFDLFCTYTCGRKITEYTLQTILWAFYVCMRLTISRFPYSLLKHGAFGHFGFVKEKSLQLKAFLKEKVY